MHTLFAPDRRRPTPCLFYPAAKELGFSVQDVLTDAQKQADLLCHIAETCPGEAVIRMTELWCEAASFGMAITFPDTDFPRLGEPLIEDPEDMETFPLPQPRNDVTAPLIDAVRLAVPRLNKPLIVGVTGPYTLGAVLSGSEDFMVNCMMEPELAQAFTDRLTDFLISYLQLYKQAGAAGVMIAEPSTAMISPDMMEQFSNRCLRRLIDAVGDDRFAVIYHNCGAVTPHLSTIATLNADAFHFGSQVDLQKACTLISSDALVMGNLEPQLFLGNHQADLERAKQALQPLLRDHENLILSTGCDLSPAARMETVRAVFTPSV